MLRTEFFAPQAKDFLSQREGFRRAAGFTVRLCKVVHRRERRRVLSTQVLVLEPTSLLKELNRFGPAADSSVSYREAVH